MSDRKRMLFIGNSHTYFNDMPAMVQALFPLLMPGTVLDTVMLAHPGRRLGEHRVEPEVRFNITYGEYDWIVLQQAAHPFPGVDSLLEDGGELVRWIHPTGAVPVMYMTWAEREAPENQAPMSAAYEGMSVETGALLCPAGRAWERLRQTHPEVELFDVDGAHASPTGSYLVACTFVALLTGRNPIGLPGRVVWQNQTLCNVPEATTVLVQEAVAWALHR